MTPDQALAYVAALGQTYEERVKLLSGARTGLYKAIRDASAQGHSVRTIAKAASLSHQRIQQIVSYKGRSE